MDTATAAQQIRDFISENFLFGMDDTFGNGDSFRDGGILDSTGILQFIAFLEETYGIKVEDEEVTPENLDTIDKASAYVCQKLAGPSDEVACPVEESAEAASS